MRILRALFIFSLLASLSSLANAQTSLCQWINNVGGASYPGGWVAVDICLTPSPNYQVLAERNRYSNGSCSINVQSGYVNVGSCISPIIIAASPPPPPPPPPPVITLTKVINDTPTNPNCSIRSVAGGFNFVIWGITCPPYSEAYVKKEYDSWNVCSVSIQSAGFSVSGQCNDYTLRKI